MSQYQIKRSDGRIEAPFSSNGLRDLARSGGLASGDRIRRLGHQTWHDVMKVPDLASIINEAMERESRNQAEEPAPMQTEARDLTQKPQAEPTRAPTPIVDFEDESGSSSPEIEATARVDEAPEDMAPPNADKAPEVEQDATWSDHDPTETTHLEDDAEEPADAVDADVAEPETNLLHDEVEDDETFEAFTEEDEQWQIHEPAVVDADDVGTDPPMDMTTTGTTAFFPETTYNPFKELRTMSTPLSGRTQNALYLILGGLMARPLMTAISSLMNDDSGLSGFLEQIGNLGAIGCTGLGVIMLLSDCLTNRGDETGSEAAMSMLLRVAMVFVIVIMLVVLMQLVGQVKLPDPTGSGTSGIMG